MRAGSLAANLAMVAVVALASFATLKVLAALLARRTSFPLAVLIVVGGRRDHLSIAALDNILVVAKLVLKKVVIPYVTIRAESGAPLYHFGTRPQYAIMLEILPRGTTQSIV